MTTLTDSQTLQLLQTLKARFEGNKNRHHNINWPEVEQRILESRGAINALYRMEETGGEPDVTGIDPGTGKIMFFDCSAESPAGRRSLCYDEDALNSRKENKPAGSALGMASILGIDILTEDQYRYLQSLGAFDLKSSSWIFTPDPIRKLGGSLFCDRRYNQVFVYHNGAVSYYAARGFRGCLMI